MPALAPIHEVRTHHLPPAGLTDAQTRRVDEERPVAERYGVFLITLVAFFLAEMGDKTQVSTLVLAARYNAVLTVVAASTFGMLCADVPAVLLAAAMPCAIPLRTVRFAAAALFALLGAVTLVGFS